MFGNVKQEEGMDNNGKAVGAMLILMTIFVQIE